MEYLKKCPKCGRYMTSEIVSTGHIKWVCICGNVVHTGFTDISYDNKTTYTGGGANDRTVIKLRKEICNSPYCNDNCKYDPCGCAYGMAMDSLEEIQQRREKGKNESMTEDEAIELIEHLYMFNENDRWMSNGPMKIFTEYLKDSLKELKQYREIDKKMADVIQNIRAKHPHGKIQEEMKRRYMREQDGENH